MPTPHLAVRVDQKTKAEWEAAAAAVGKSVSVFIRDAVNAELGRAAIAPPKKKRIAGRQTTDAAAGMCVHRVSLESFCGRCG